MAKTSRFDLITQQYKDLKRQLGLKDEQIAHAFGLRNANSYRNSPKFDKYKQIFVQMAELILDKSNKR